MSDCLSEEMASSHSLTALKQSKESRRRLTSRSCKAFWECAITHDSSSETTLTLHDHYLPSWKRMNPSFGQKPRTQLWASSNSACALLHAWPTQTQENNYIWMLDSLISASAQAYTSSMTKTSEWSLMQAKRCFPYKYSNCEKALLCTVWVIQLFSNYIGAQKVIIETCHQPVNFLNSQRIRDGVVTNARIATWLMTLQRQNVEARHAQNYKSSHGNELAACQNCSTDTLHIPAEPKEPLQSQLTNHGYFEENVCEGMPTAYVDGCSYDHKGNLQVGAGVVWLNNDPCPSWEFNLENSLIAICWNSRRPHHTTNGCIPQHQRTPYLYRFVLRPPKLHMPFSFVETEWIQDS